MTETVVKTKKKYQVDREVFLRYYSVMVYEMTRQPKVLEAMILGSEFIIDTNDILQAVGWVNGKLFGRNAPIHFSNVELTYKR